MDRAQLACNLAALALCSGLFLLYLATPLERGFSDSDYLIRHVSISWQPYYNVVYLPLGRTVHRLTAPLGWSVESALLVIDALAAAAAVGVTYVWLVGLGVGDSAVGRARCLLAVGVLGLAPVTRFFAAISEVHTVAMLGSACALLLASKAATKSGAQSLLFASLACVVALLTHLSHVFLVPSLIALAWTRGAARGLQPTRAVKLALAGTTIAAVLVGTVLLSPQSSEWLHVPVIGTLAALGRFTRLYIESFAEVGALGPELMTEYVWRDWVRPAGLLACAGLALFVRRAADAQAASSFRRAVWAPILALAVMLNSGILERGGYLLSYLPIAALGLVLLLPRGGIRLWLAGALLLSAQGGIGEWDRRCFLESHPAGRPWAMELRGKLESADVIIVADVARMFALLFGHPADVAPRLALDRTVVLQQWFGTDLEHQIGEQLKFAGSTGRVLIDAQFVDDLSSLPLWARTMQVDWSDPRIRLVPIGPSHEPLAYWLQPAGSN